VRQSVSLLLIAVQSLLASAFLHNQVPIGLQRHGGARGRVAPEVRRARLGKYRLPRQIHMTATNPQSTVGAQQVATPELGLPEGLLVRYYDTTLRDGAQGEGIALSCDDKLRIAARLSKFGADYIEAGWPGSNPKDAEFFQRAQGELTADAWNRVVAFGSTRYKNIKVEEDKQVQMLIDSNARVVTLVGKSWDLHVDQVLETTHEENLAMIRDTVRYLRAKGIEVMLDAEHFYDGHRANPEYAMQCLSAAVEADVDWLVLCDTNGGSLPWDVEEVTRKVATTFPGTKIGVHCHNDQGMAVANSLAAVRGGASLIQGTVNGYGERTGNANIMSVLPTLALSMQQPSSVSEPALAGLTSLSRYVDEQANQPSNQHAAFVGGESFAKTGCYPGANPQSDSVVANSCCDPNSYTPNRPRNPDQLRRGVTCMCARGWRAPRAYSGLFVCRVRAGGVPRAPRRGRQRLQRACNGQEPCCRQ
jgi:isopropylmalate/homocitrate/citramalate synthase